MTNKEASNVLRLFANLIEINGLPEERILTFRKAYEQAIFKLESDTTPQGEWKRHDEWRTGEYIGGFYHVNCPCEDGYYSKWETNFCPNCGLPMKKGGAE